MPDTLGEWIWSLGNLVIGGILVNLISRKLDNPFDKLLAWIHAPLLERSQAKQQEIERLLNMMKDDRIAATLIYSRELRSKSDENTVMILLLIFLLSALILYQIDQIISLSLLVLAFLLMFAALYLQNKHTLLTEAIKRYEKLQDSRTPRTSTLLKGGE